MISTPYIFSQVFFICLSFHLHYLYWRFTSLYFSFLLFFSRQRHIFVPTTITIHIRFNIQCSNAVYHKINLLLVGKSRPYFINIIIHVISELLVYNIHNLYRGGYSWLQLNLKTANHRIHSRSWMKGLYYLYNTEKMATKRIYEFIKAYWLWCRSSPYT